MRLVRQSLVVSSYSFLSERFIVRFIVAGLCSTDEFR